MSVSDDQPPKLYAAQEPVFPRKVYGNFRNLKWAMMVVTLGIYYITPWIRWDRGPNLPDQAVLIDMADRRFFFFWIEIWPQEFYLVAGLLVMAGLGLFLFTSALGRVWCGYSCPQTVWTDLFVVVERWIEGDRNARVRLYNSKWGARKIRLRTTKWTIWLLISAATGGAWVFYFMDAPFLLHHLFVGRAPYVAYAFVVSLTATTFLFGGFLREQICIYMCPWPRIQAAMIDEETVTVSYRDWRGEPRGKHRKSAEAVNLGDCIDCAACVNVCPMGIDIRDGQQMECITCALCIDACDDVMQKIGKPRGLIDYISLTDEISEREGNPPISAWNHVIRLRTIIYTGIWLAIGASLILALFMRAAIDLNVSPVRNPIFVTLSDGSIRNTFNLRIRNKQGEARPFEISISPTEGFELKLQGNEASIVNVPADSTGAHKVFVTAKKGSLASKSELTHIRIWVKDTVNGDRVYRDTVFNGNQSRN
ncbi:MAG: cytochrome c oxidase accessory protein CcoG [Alphaproteobacteria bacterium]|nr:cytochrome c oxidase accessory protein CcoG [Alphaproteobacteria bacterium]